ncbi:uncharacterized protein LOC125942510 [Dermacentor silvarum]|uniref:uncharacterized protein LOC125942510 n=1 Tax=Dermacentor silvarum TaxID=543639 RepID=UPI002100C0EF|nr:uncharacterized protein LOC125942510 [Dermacentor silvarum]
MSVPTHAYVRYHDGASALVAVGLIREFSPQSVSDVAKNKLVYWAEPGEESEDYYPADVVVLGVSKKDLITSMAKKRIAVPSTEFDCPPSQATSVVAPKLARQAARENMQLSKKAKEMAILRKKRSRSSSHFSESEDDLVEKSLFKKEQRRCKVLEEKNRVLYEKLKKERLKNEKLQALLTTKFDMLLTRLQGNSRLASVATEMDLEHPSLEDDIFQSQSPGMDMVSTESFEDVVPAASTAASRTVAQDVAPAAPTAASRTVAQDVVPAAPAAASRTVAQDEVPAAPAAASRTVAQDVAPTEPPVASTALPQQQVGGGEIPQHLPPLFKDENGQVHIGYGIVVPSNKWAALMCVPRDSLFCKEGARVLWTAADLKERSVKGQVCRRFVKNPESLAKKPMTPKKLLALNNAFSHFVDLHPDAKNPSERKKKLNYFLAEMLQDMRKK